MPIHRLDDHLDNLEAPSLAHLGKSDPAEDESEEEDGRFNHAMQNPIAAIVKPGSLLRVSREERNLEAAKLSQARRTRYLLEDVAREFGVDADTVFELVIKLQRAYRTSVFVYARFGPTLFIDSQGNSSHGTIDFMVGSIKPAPWMRVTHTTSAKRLLRHFDHNWGLPRPEVLITVTGGAQNFSLSAELQACRI